MADMTLDLKGLNCPSPIIQAKKAMNGLDSGDTIEILSTDSGSVKDFNLLCLATGSALLESNEDNGVFRFVIKKK